MYVSRYNFIHYTLIDGLGLIGPQGSWIDTHLGLELFLPSLIKYFCILSVLPQPIITLFHTYTDSSQQTIQGPFLFKFAFHFTMIKEHILKIHDRVKNNEILILPMFKSYIHE